MERFVDKARSYGINNLGLRTTKNSFLAIFEAIESEFKALADRIEKIEFQLPSYSVFNKFQSFEGRIKALEKTVRLQSSEKEKARFDMGGFDSYSGTTLAGRIDELESRIKALEKKYSEMLELMSSMETLERIKKLKVEVGLTSPEKVLPGIQPKAPVPCDVPFQAPLPYDRHGKPEGGLEPGDWLLGYGVGEPSLWIGEFNHMEKEQFVWANWREIEKVKREGMGTTQFRMPKGSVVFLFRSEPKEKS